MGIYIKGMEMPKSCGECDYCHPTDKFPCWCYLVDIPIKPSETDLRDGLCPLIEVTEPHGNLIDYNFVYDELEKICTRCKNVGADRIDPKCDICWVNDFLSILNTAPTVIEAEGE